MKNYIIGIVLALALVMGVVAFAETAEPATDSIPSVSEEAPNEGAASETPSTEAEKIDNNAALLEALGAYRSAQESKYGKEQDSVPFSRFLEISVTSTSS